MTGMTLARLQNDALLFDEAGQKLYELDALSATVWTALRDGGQPAAVAVLEPTGLGAEAAAAYIASCLDQWARLGIAPTAPHAGAGGPDALREFHLACAEHRFTVRLPDAAAQEAATEIFGHLATSSGDIDFTVGVQTCEAGYLLEGVSGTIAASTADGLAVALKNDIFERILARRPSMIALHAAALAAHTGGLLLAGASGSGKSTLAALLNQRAMPLIADDVCLLDAASGQVSGLPFAFALKPGSWQALEPHCPGLRELPVRRRPDGKLVRYLAPTIVASRARIARIIFPRYMSGAPVSECALRKAEALTLLLQEARNAGQRLSTHGFETLCRVLAEAQVSTLAFGRAEEAVQHIMRRDADV